MTCTHFGTVSVSPWAWCVRAAIQGTPLARTMRHLSCDRRALELSEPGVPPVEVLEQIREIEQRAREAGDRIRQARDEMRLCAGEYERADRQWDGQAWYTGGLGDEARKLGEIVAELDVLILDLEERGW
jgi:hypothetical protein